MKFYLVPEITLGSAVVLGAYVYAISRWNPDRRSEVASWRIAAFFVGVLTVFITLHPPIDVLSASFFSVHMFQHVLLTLVAPPMLLLGLPEWLVAPLFRKRLAQRFARWITKPVVAGLIGVGVFWGWHLPTLYEATLRDRIVHDGMHMTLVVSAIVMWWPVLSRLPEAPAASIPMQMFYLFLITLPSGLLSSIYVFASEPIYPAYSMIADPDGLSALNDQRVGGLVMKLGGTAILWTVISVKYFRWAAAEPSKSQLVIREPR